MRKIRLEILKLLAEPAQGKHLLKFEWSLVSWGRVERILRFKFKLEHEIFLRILHLPVCLKKLPTTYECVHILPNSLLHFFLQALYIPVTFFHHKPIHVLLILLPEHRPIHLAGSPYIPGTPNLFYS